MSFAVHAASLASIASVGQSHRCRLVGTQSHRCRLAGTQTLSLSLL